MLGAGILEQRLCYPACCALQSVCQICCTSIALTINGEQLGADPGFDFHKYDLEHDSQVKHDAQEGRGLQPAWLKVDWYRELVTPAMTLTALRSGERTAYEGLIQLRRPFNLPVSDLRMSQTSLGAVPCTTDPEGLQGPLFQFPRQYQHVAHRHARIALRTQWRYGITPSLWQARWGITRV